MSLETISVNEGRLNFIFPTNWLALSYDRSTFYRGFPFSFQSLPWSKAVDILALDPSRSTLWLIEVKDYRRPPFAHHDVPDKTLHIIESIAAKASNTLAGLWVACHDTRPHNDLRAFAQIACKASKIRVVLHREMPERKANHLSRSLLRSDQQNATIRLRQCSRAIDPFALITRMATLPPEIPWKVEDFTQHYIESHYNNSDSDSFY